MSGIMEIVVDGKRVEIDPRRLFSALGSGELRGEDILFLDGVPGRIRDLDERLIDGENVLFLRGSPQERRVMKRFHRVPLRARAARPDPKRPEGAPRSIPASVEENFFERGVGVSAEMRISKGIWKKAVFAAVLAILLFCAYFFLTPRKSGDVGSFFFGLGKLNAAEYVSADDPDESEKPKKHDESKKHDKPAKPKESDEDESWADQFGDDIAGLLDENLVEERTWPKAFAEAQDRTDDWERSLATIVVPDQYPTLAAAINAASDGDVIWLSKGTYPIAEPTMTHRPVVPTKVNKKLVIRGRSKNPGEVVVTLTARDALLFESCRARVRGITFKYLPDNSKTEQEALVKIGKKSEVIFKYCDFVGGAGGHYGVRLTEGKGSFWKCNFSSFDTTGLFAENKGVANVSYCEFGRDNVCAFDVGRESKGTILTCRFFNNKLGVSAREGGAARIEDSFFEDNYEPWSIKIGTTQNVVRKNNVVF